MIPDGLEKLEDDDLRAVIARAEELLAQHDRERKADALARAKALLESVGLSIKDVAGGRTKAVKPLTYKAGHVYHHPENKALTWNAKGKKPRWAAEVEATGRRLIEVPPANDNPAPGIAANENAPATARKSA